MKKVFVIVLIGISFPVLSAIVLYSVSFCFSLTGPPAEYGTEIKDRVQYVSSEHGDHLIYNGSKYYLNDMSSCFHSSEEKLDIISWSYGFPFRAAFVYRAPDIESPDYIVGYHEIYFKEGWVPENGIYSIENSSAEICLSQIYKHGDSKDLSYDYLVSDFNMYSETCPGLYLDVSIFKFEETYYISFSFSFLFFYPFILFTLYIILLVNSITFRLHLYYFLMTCFLCKKLLILFHQ